LWLTRTELAYLFVLGAMAIVAPVATVCILLPLLVLRMLQGRSKSPMRGRTASAAFFLAIGLAYLLLEMTLLSRLTYLIGDPVQTAALTIASFLVLSGVGSLLAQRMHRPSSRRVRWLMIALVAAGLVQMLLANPISSAAGSFAFPIRALVAVGVIAPVALLMGFPMPLALARLEKSQPALLPWVWGANGFASVFAAPLATAISMSWGFGVTSVIALTLYLMAALTFAYLPEN
jgi:hypothetical protein